jgi:hypothetical protein
LFFEDLDDKLIVKGIQFNAQNQDDFLVTPCYNSLEFLKQIHDEPTEEFEAGFNSHLKARLESITGPHQDKDKSEEFNRQLGAAQKIRNLLIELSDDYSKLIKGIFYQISGALEYSHVRGDRMILNSDDCVSHTRYRIKPPHLLEKYRDHSDPIRIYADYLSEGFSLGVIRHDLSFKGDFVNHSFQKYMLSLRGYEIVNRTYDLKLRGSKRDSPDNVLIYLDVKDKSGNTLGFQDVGSGISYVLPIITSLWCKKLSLIEQPELHLHPKAQCELADVFIASLNLGNASVIESHSEHILLRLGRRIRETTNGYLLPNELKLSPDDVNIYYFDPQPNGSTSVKKIRLDKQGELMDRWPGGFFSERDRELFGE